MRRSMLADRGSPADAQARPTALGCRLVVRVRVHVLAADGELLGRLTRRFFDVGDTVMENTMLAGIKQRAERDVVRDACADDDPGVESN